MLYDSRVFVDNVLLSRKYAMKSNSNCFMIIPLSAIDRFVSLGL